MPTTCQRPRDLVKLRGTFRFLGGTLCRLLFQLAGLYLFFSSEDKKDKDVPPGNSNLNTDKVSPEKSTAKLPGAGLLKTPAQPQDPGHRWPRSNNANISSNKPVRLGELNSPRSRIPVLSPKSNSQPDFPPLHTHCAPNEEAAPGSQDLVFITSVSGVNLATMEENQQWGLVDSFRNVHCQLCGLRVDIDTAISQNTDARGETEQSLRLMLSSPEDIVKPGHRLLGLQSGLIELDAHLDALEQGVSVD